MLDVTICVIGKFSYHSQIPTSEGTERAVDRYGASNIARCCKAAIMHRSTGHLAAELPMGVISLLGLMGRSTRVRAAFIEEGVQIAYFGRIWAVIRHTKTGALCPSLPPRLSLFYESAFLLCLGWVTDSTKFRLWRLYGTGQSHLLVPVFRQLLMNQDYILLLGLGFARAHVEVDFQGFVGTFCTPPLMFTTIED